ncbi:MAG: ferritin [Archaeoglobaceae archaeon]
MLSDRMLEALNRQINAEIYSAYLYLSMAAYFDSKGLKGFTNWLKVQWQEELEHAMRLYEYVVSRGGRVRLYAIEEPPHDWESPLAAFEHVYRHEVNVTKSIHELVDLAVEEKDYATYNMLQWFVSEQVEEEANASEIVEKLRMVSDGSGLLMLDRELAARRFVPEGEAEGQKL